MKIICNFKNTYFWELMRQSLLYINIETTLWLFYLIFILSVETEEEDHHEVISKQIFILIIRIS